MVKATRTILLQLQQDRYKEEQLEQVRKIMGYSLNISKKIPLTNINMAQPDQTEQTPNTNVSFFEPDNKERTGVCVCV